MASNFESFFLVRLSEGLKGCTVGGIEAEEACTFILVKGLDYYYQNSIFLLL